MNAQIKVSVNEDRYRFSHDRTPQGSGLWLFRVKETGTLVACFGTYARAKEDACRAVAAKLEGSAYSVVTLCVEP